MAADSILQQVCRHPFVDRSKPTVIFDFITPVTVPAVVPEEIEPGKKKAGKRKLDPVEPMPLDLTTLLSRLESFTIADAEEFYAMLVGVFDNALQLTLKQESSLLKHLVKRLQQLVEYVKWLCLELLPLSVTEEESSSTQASSSNSNSEANAAKQLTAARREEFRKKRIDILRVSKIDKSGTGSIPFAECRKVFG